MALLHATLQQAVLGHEVKELRTNLRHRAASPAAVLSHLLALFNRWHTDTHAKPFNLPNVCLQSFACDAMGPCQALPLNSAPIPFESELFRGVVAVYVRHLSSTPGHMFKGKKRLIWIALQVRMGWVACVCVCVMHVVHAPGIELS